MAKASKRPRDGALTRASIEREALRLFAQKGVDGATIRDLSLAVGVADAALYRYYPSKEDIASDIFTRHYGALAKAIRVVAGKNLPFPRATRELVDLFCKLFDDTPDVFTFILLNQHTHLRYVTAGENVVDEIVAIMARARASGEIATDDPELAAAMALGAVLQAAVFKIYGRLPGPLRERAGALALAATKSAGGVG